MGSDTSSPIPKEKYSTILDLGFGAVESGNILAIFLIDLVRSLAPSLFVLEASLRIIHAAVLAWRVAHNTHKSRLQLIVESITAMTLVVGVMLGNFFTASLSALFMPIVFLSICVGRTIISFVAAFHYWYKSELTDDPIKKELYLEKAKRNAIGFIAGSLTSVAVAFALILSKLSWTIAGITAGVISCFYMSYKFFAEIAKPPEEIQLAVFNHHNFSNLKETLQQKYSPDATSKKKISPAETKKDLANLTQVICEEHPDFVNKNLEVEISEIKPCDSKEDSESKIEISTIGFLSAFEEEQIRNQESQLPDDLVYTREKLEILHKKLAEKNYDYDEEDLKDINYLNQEISNCNMQLRLFKSNSTRNNTIQESLGRRSVPSH